LTYFNRIQINQHIIELFEQEETRGHTLTTRNRITLARGSANELEVLLRNFKMVSRFLLLAQRGIHYAFQNVLLQKSAHTQKHTPLKILEGGWWGRMYLGRRGFNVFHEIKGGDDIVVAEVVDDQVESSFWDHV
jgi:hypothetical protein